MNDDDTFQAVLDANPEDHTTRLVFADWLEERGDPRAEGYRALGRLARVPTWAFNQSSGNKPWFLWASDQHVGRLVKSKSQHAAVLRRAALPADWCRKVYLVADKDRRRHWNHKNGWFGYGQTRREAEDAAALAFSKLSPQRRAELLAGKGVEPTVAATKRKPKPKPKGKK